MEIEGVETTSLNALYTAQPSMDLKVRGAPPPTRSNGPTAHVPSSSAAGAAGNASLERKVLALERSLFNAQQQCKQLEYNSGGLLHQLKEERVERAEATAAGAADQAKLETRLSGMSEKISRASATALKRERDDERQRETERRQADRVEQGGQRRRRERQTERGRDVRRERDRERETIEDDDDE